MVGVVAEGGVGVALKYYLRDAVTVTDVDERHAAHLTCPLHPAGKGHFTAGIAQAEFSACICPVHKFLVS
jgi:glycine/D-amino acid oxidase-like deaminating enzyme